MCDKLKVYLQELNARRQVDEIYGLRYDENGTLYGVGVVLFYFFARNSCLYFNGVNPNFFLNAEIKREQSEKPER